LDAASVPVHARAGSGTWLRMSQWMDEVEKVPGRKGRTVEGNKT
jgi:hypothetical protein